MATFLESYTELIPGPDMLMHCQTQHSARAYADYLNSTDPRHACWLAEYAATGAPIGYATTCPPDLPVPLQDGDVELKRIYVLSRFHGSGAGKRLSDTVMAFARGLQAPRLLLGTYQDNQRAVAFYKREGFTQIGTRQFQVGHQVFDDIVMGMALA